MHPNATPSSSQQTTRNTKARSPTPETSTTNVLSSGQEDDANQETSQLRFEWTAGLTKKLIHTMDELMEDFKSARNKKPVWRKVSDTIDYPGVTADRCMDKWKNLKRSYRNHVQNVNMSGAGPSKFTFADDMAKALGDNPSVTPRYVIDSEGHEQRQEAEVEDEPTEAESDNMEETTRDDSSRPVKRPTKEKDSVGMMKEFERISRERDAEIMNRMEIMHQETVAVLNKIAEKL